MDDQVRNASNAAKFDNLEELKRLCPSRVPVEASTYSYDNHLHTLLMCAAAHGSVLCAKYLLDNGANAAKKNFTGFSALHWAAFAGRTETVEMLIKAGARIDAKSEDGRTPCHVAAFRGHLEFLQLLQKLGADLNATTCDGWTAIHYAVIANHQPVAKFLLAHGVDYTEPDVNGKTINDLVDEYGRTWFDEFVNSDE